MRTQSEKATAFRELHQRDQAFIIPNPWSIGTAHVLAHLGFEALATTSSGYAFSVGCRDNAIARDQMLEHVSQIAAATDLPVSADMEHGYGDDPQTVAETVRLAAGCGLAGCSIEDSTKRPDDPVFELEHAAERIRAAAEAADSLDFPFTLTARAENFITGRPDIDDTIRRLQAYQEAGADVLYAPGLATRDDIVAVVGSLDRPVNVLMGLQGVRLGLAELSQIGVKRISVGGALARAAWGGFLRAAREMQEHGTFEFSDEAASFRDLIAMFPK